MPFMIRMFAISAALALGVTAVVAQGDPIATRKQTMKGVGDATRIGNQMAKGEVPFDAAKAREIFKVYADAADRMHNYFPENSKTGGDTAALPAVWENRADFRKRFDDWAADIKKAAANTKDLDSFKAEFTTVTRSCGGCHQTYRLSRS
jgi:cytochrome c556